MTTTEQPTEDLQDFSRNTSTPAEALATCRHAQGLAGLAHSDGRGGCHLAARHDDVVAVQADPATFSSHPTVFRPIAPGVPPFPFSNTTRPSTAPGGRCSASWSPPGP